MGNPLNDAKVKAMEKFETEIKTKLKLEGQISERYLRAWAGRYLGLTSKTMVKYLYDIVELNKDIFMDFDKRDNIMLRQKEVVENDRNKRKA